MRTTMAPMIAIFLPLSVHPLPLRNILLETVETIAEVHLPYEVLEDNIEGQSFEEHVNALDRGSGGRRL